MWRASEDFSPGRTPQHIKLSEHGLDADAKKRFESLTRIELGTPAFDAVTSDEIFATQRRCLTTIPVDQADLTTLKNRLLVFAEKIGIEHKKIAQ